MKALLTSAGFTSAEIIKACERLVSKKSSRIKVVTIEDAAHAETGDKTWFEEEKRQLEGVFNSQNISVLPLQSESLSNIKSQILAADLIYCYGGNADALTKIFEETGFAKLLPELLEQKVWVGSSAGSCVLCHKETAQTAQEVYLEHPAIDHYLDLIEIVFLPHYQGDFKFGREEIDREAKAAQMPVFAVSDDSALQVTVDKHGKSKSRSGKGQGSNLKIENIGEGVSIGLDTEDIEAKVADALRRAANTVSKSLRIFDK